VTVGVTKSITIVSFNDNEAAAVEALLDDIAPPGGMHPWGRAGSAALRRAFGEDEWRLEHVSVRAQGNVVAAAQLAEIFSDREKKPDYVVFYGCAGAFRQEHARSAFLVQHANYVSLGTVREKGGVEIVTLKNKWICILDGTTVEVAPLPIVDFPMVLPSRGPLDVSALSGIPGARVIATDKVIEIPPGKAPAPAAPSPPADRYAKAEWTYAEALGLWAGASDAVIVEMESYGIGRIAQALKLDDRVVVLRVTTDSLTDKGGSDAAQETLLHDARHLLGHLIAVLFNPARYP
jgi:nucleoside phosphorylase